MLSGIAGSLTDLSDNLAQIEPTPSITVEVHLPAYLARSLATQISRRVSLTTKLVLEGQASGSSLTPRLIGFADAPERAFFEKFTTVRGVGTRKALRALIDPPPTVIAAVARRDAKALQAMPEIGKRLAETVIAELHGKLDDLGFPLVTDPDDPRAATIEPLPAQDLSPPAADALAALIALGESRPDAERKLALASRDAPDDVSAETLISIALGA